MKPSQGNHNSCKRNPALCAALFANLAGCCCTLAPHCRQAINNSIRPFCFDMVSDIQPLNTRGWGLAFTPSVPASAVGYYLHLRSHLILVSPLPLLPAWCPVVQQLQSTSLHVPREHFVAKAPIQEGELECQLLFKLAICKWTVLDHQASTGSNKPAGYWLVIHYVCPLCLSIMSSRH